MFDSPKYEGESICKRVGLICKHGKLSQSKHLNLSHTHFVMLVNKDIFYIQSNRIQERL